MRASLAYLSITCALALMTRHQTICILGLITLIVVLYLLIDRRGESYGEGTLFILLTPSAYVIALWFAANWLIIGLPAFFIRGVLPPAITDVSFIELATEGCEWDGVLLPLCLAIVTWAIVRIIPSSWPPLYKCIAILVLAGVVLRTDYRLEQQPREHAPQEELAEVVEYVEAKHRKDKVIISGYTGYEILRLTKHPRTFIHVMHLYMPKILADTRGQHLYLLVPRPEDVARWDDVSLSLPGIYQEGRDFTLYEKGWDNWQLLRIVRTDR